jgi:hypothetical protein
MRWHVAMSTLMKNTMNVFPCQHHCTVSNVLVCLNMKVTLQEFINVTYVTVVCRFVLPCQPCQEIICCFDEDVSCHIPGGSLGEGQARAAEQPATTQKSWRHRNTSDIYQIIHISYIYNYNTLYIYISMCFVLLQSILLESVSVMKHFNSFVSAVGSHFRRFHKSCLLSTKSLSSWDEYSACSV